MPVQSTKGSSVTITPNAVRYGLHLDSYIDSNGGLQVRGVIRLQRAEKSAEGKWQDDPSVGSSVSIPFAPNMAAWLTAQVSAGKVSPTTAVKIAAAWDALDDALNSLNSELKLV
jgi:hypothetical protein